MLNFYKCRQAMLNRFFIKHTINRSSRFFHPTLSQQEEEVLCLPISVLQDDLSKLFIRGQAYLKLGSLDARFYTEAIDSFVRITESNKALICDKIAAYIKCAQLSALRQDNQSEERYVELIENTLKTQLEEKGSKISLKPMEIIDLMQLKEKLTKEKLMLGTDSNKKFSNIHQ